MLIQPISSFISFLEPVSVISDKVPKETAFTHQRGGGRGSGWWRCVTRREHQWMNNLKLRPEIWGKNAEIRHTTGSSLFIPSFIFQWQMTSKVKGMMGNGTNRGRRYHTSQKEVMIYFVSSGGKILFFWFNYFRVSTHPWEVCDWRDFASTAEYSQDREILPSAISLWLQLDTPVSLENWECQN